MLFNEVKMKSKLVTVGTIAREIGMPIYTVQYYLASRKIKPKARAGRLRIYDRGTIERIRQEYESNRGSDTDAS